MVIQKLERHFEGLSTGIFTCLCVRNMYVCQTENCCFCPSSELLTFSHCSSQRLDSLEGVRSNFFDQENYPDVFDRISNCSSSSEDPQSPRDFVTIEAEIRKARAKLVRKKTMGVYGAAELEFRHRRKPQLFELAAWIKLKPIDELPEAEQEVLRYSSASLWETHHPFSVCCVTK